ncbi:MAG: FliM/FliN family flagellar motor switch protein [Pseudomonadota bacterium]
MGDDENLIRRKVESARSINSPLPRLNETLAALITKLEKDARVYLGTLVEAMILDVENKAFSDVLDAMSMPAMIAVIEIDGVDRAALINMDLDLVYHVVDLRMGGSPSELPEFGARRPTGIDNAMCMPLVDIILEGFAHGLQKVFGVDEAFNMRCKTFEHLPMSANIAPERSDVLCVKVSLDIGESARSGDFELVLPFATLDLLASRLKNSAAISSSGRDAWAGHMLDVVLETEVDLRPVIHSSMYSVAEISRLEVGSVIELDPGAQSAVDLQFDLPGDPVQLAPARLGSLKTNKALKLSADPAPEFFDPLRALVAAAAETER